MHGYSTLYTYSSTLKIIIGRVVSQLEAPLSCASSLTGDGVASSLRLSAFRLACSLLLRLISALAVIWLARAS